MKKKIISLIAAAAMAVSTLPMVAMADEEVKDMFMSNDFDAYENEVDYYHEGALDYDNKVLVDGTLSMESYDGMEGMVLYTTNRAGGDDSSYWQLTKDANGGQALTTQVSRFSSSGRGAKIEFTDTYEAEADKVIILEFDVNVSNDAETNYDPSIQINGDDAYQIDFVNGLKIPLDTWARVAVCITTEGTRVLVNDSEEPAIHFAATSLSSITFNGMIEGIAAGDAIKAESNPFGYPTISLDNMEIYAVSTEGPKPETDPEATADPEATEAPEATEVPEATAKPEANFANVSDWAKETIDAAVEADLVPAEMLSSDLTKQITREEFAAVAVKLYESLSGAPAPEAKIVAFSDVADSEYASYITKAYVLNIVNGVSETEFAPKATITREQMATMLTRAIKAVTIEGWSLENDCELEMSEVAAFKDDAEISPYASNSVYYMAANGIVKGMDETHFAPQGTATSEQAVVIAQRVQSMFAQNKEATETEAAAE